jgi:simple sugar transport system ATP-binding protein
MNALELESVQLTKRFGAFTALDQVSLRVRPGTVHALLGENGAGKSTFVKCIVGYHRSDQGSLILDQREREITSPSVARLAGIGMVYQHFTLAPGMSVAENLLLARGEIPAIVNWRHAHRELESFMETAPFSIDLHAMPGDLAAGQKQKLEILKQIILRPRLLILDEPTSVLTPQEADEVLGALRIRAHAGECSIILITHKFHEVSAYADDVSVLRRGRLVLSQPVSRVTPQLLAQAMVGDAPVQPLASDANRSMHSPDVIDQSSTKPRENPVLTVQDLVVMGDRGDLVLNGLSLELSPGEILGIAGVSGNGQKELLQGLTGQRKILSGQVRVDGKPFSGTRAQNRALRVRSLPEEPLQNACVPNMTVTQNMALRDFDESPNARAGFVRWGRLRKTALRWIGEYRIKTSGPDASVRSLSGGNVQRAVLARELSADARLLLVSNPTFGLDFAATAEVRLRLKASRDRGTAVLLISEDLDELLEVSDRVAVISSGRIVHEVDASSATRQSIGAQMAGLKAPIVTVADDRLQEKRS